MNLNAIPIIGWILDIIVSASMALPFWIIWTLCGMGEKYFYWLPDVYKQPGFFECVGLFIAVNILRCIVLPSMKCSNECKGKD